MSEKDRVLYQFPISHYCEKTRWNLDAKGLSYRVANLVPGLHSLTTRRLSGAGSVPMLADGAHVVGDSAAIAAYLEHVYPERPLLPADEGARARALELEAYFGAHTGHAVRRWLYGQLGARPGGIAEVLLRDYPARVRLAGKVALHGSSKALLTGIVVNGGASTG